MKVIYQHYGVAQPHNYSNEFLSRLVLCFGAPHLWYNMSFHNSVWSSKTVAAACFASSEDAALFPAANQSPGRFLAHHPAFAQIKYVKERRFIIHICSVLSRLNLQKWCHFSCDRWANIRSVSRLWRWGSGGWDIIMSPSGQDWLTDLEFKHFSPRCKNSASRRCYSSWQDWGCDCHGWIDGWKFRCEARKLF